MNLQDNQGNGLAGTCGARHVKKQGGADLRSSCPRLSCGWLSALLALAIAAGFLPSAARADSDLMAPRPTLTIHRVSRPPRVEDFLEMKPSREIAGELTKVQNFIQRLPLDGQAPTQRTDVYLGYDDKYFYAVFVAFDSEPRKVRARMSVRDQLTDDERLDLFLDTFHDHRHAFVFTCNPLGIQQDGRWDEGAKSQYDSTFDTVWKSRGRLTRRGFVVLMAVPFKSLRFPNVDQQTWGILFIRWMARNNESDTWPRVSTRLEGRLGQEATLEGLKGLSRARNVQLIPYTFARNYRALDTRDPNNPHFVSSALDPSAGIDGKMVLKDRLVLDATLNPDFSQIESDQPQITVDQRFEVFFPEKRPFFLENASFFETPINLFFSRRIADPQFGVRLTGKVGPYALGALVADDQAPGEAVPPSDPLAGQRAHFTVLRVNRDLGRQSTLGAMFTDYQFAGSSNRVAGLDGRFKLTRNWVLSWQGVTTSTDSLDGTHTAGPAYNAQIRYTGLKLLYYANYDDRSPGYNTAAGFIADNTVDRLSVRSRTIVRPTLRTDMRGLEQFAEYRFRPENKFLISWGPTLLFNPVWDHEGNPLDRYYDAGFGVELTGQSFIEVYQNADHELLRPQDFSVLTANREYVQNRKGIFVRNQMLPKANFQAEYTWGTGVNFVPPTGQAPVLANLNVANALITLRPVTKLRNDNTYILERLTDRAGGGTIFTNHIIRSKWNWQFDPRFSVRTIFQYTTVLPNSALTSLQKTRQFNADFLFTYLANPWTALYVGYNHDLQNLDLLPTLTGAEIIRTDRFKNDGRQFFVKFSYWFGF